MTRRPLLDSPTVLPRSPNGVDLAVDVVADDERGVEQAIVRVFAFEGDRAYLAGTTQTDTAGHGALSSLPAGAAWIVVDHEGFARASTARVLEKGLPALKVRLHEGHGLAVHVVDDLDASVAGAEIEVSSKDALPVGVRTDAKGDAETHRLDEGPWSVLVRAPGFEEERIRAAPEGERLRVVVRKLGALVVHVVDEQGRPSPLARVEVAGTGLWPPRATDARSDGIVRVGGLAAGQYALRATSGTLVSHSEIGLPLARGEERDVTLKLEPGLFATAHVAEETDDGDPVPGARLTVVESGLSPFPMAGVSDEHGNCHLGPVVRGSSALLSAQADGFVPRGSMLVPDDGGPVTVVMLRAGTIEGRVVDVRGRPVGGATLEIVGTSFSGEPIEDDPAKRSFQRTEFDLTLAGRRPLVPSGELGVVPGPVPPIPLASPLPVALQGIPAPSEPWVTKDDGTYRASPASPGRIRVVVRHPEYLETVSDVLKLAPGGTAQVDLVLKEGGSLEGRVVDAGGRPVAGANVTLAASRGSLERSMSSASDGTFAFAAVPEEVVVTAAVGEDSDGRIAQATAEVPHGGKATVTLTLADPRPPLSVHVSDDRGYPVGAAQISVGSVEPSIPFRTTAFSDARGDASIPGAQGVSLRVEVSAPGHAFRSLMASKTKATLDITLDSAKTITGTVRDARSGTVLPRAEVTLFSDTLVRRTETDGDGIFRLHDVGGGSVRLRARAAGHVSLERSIALVDAASGTLDLPPFDLAEDGIVTGTVLDAAREPVAGARVGQDHVPTYVPAGVRDASFALTDSRGRFRLAGLPDGTVTLEAYAPDVGRARTDVRVTTGRTTSDVVLSMAEPEAKQPQRLPTSSGGVAVTLGELSGDPPEVVIVEVAEGSEAERGGLSVGDVITAIDGVPVSRIAAARARLAGPVGNDVVIERRREHARETDALRIGREAVHR